MIYTFYNKNIPIFDIEYQKEYGFGKIKKILNPEYAPYGLYIPGVNKFGIYFKDWWANRLIPTTRHNFDYLFSDECYDSPSDIAINNFGLSLSDQYWLCPTDAKSIFWKDINFFNNDFLFDFNLNYHINQKSEYLSPNPSTSGDLPKKWVILNSKRYLYKGSSRPFNQEAINEFIASKILERLNISHVEYLYEKQCSLCPCFIDENTEYVPAWNVYLSKKRKNSENSINIFRG